MNRSLSSLVDRAAEARFFGRELPARAALIAAQAIAERQGLPGAYARMFAPTEFDFRRGIRVFTGEPVRSKVAIAHILGEECCRLLLDLNLKDKTVTEALARAEQGILHLLNAPVRKDVRHVGFYCCGICTVSFWRHLAAGGLDRPGPRFKDGLQVLAGYRTREGRWRRFPFFYTLLVLTEIDRPAARTELRWARPAIERSLKSLRATDRYALRRRMVLELALERAG